MKKQIRRPALRAAATVSAGALMATFAAAEAHAASGTWTSLTGGNWSLNTNWSGNTIADGATFNANFSTLNIVTSTRTVTIDGTSRTLGSVTIGDNNGTDRRSYAIAAAAGLSLTLDNGASAATITQIANSNGDTFSTPIVLNSSLDITNSAVRVLNFTTGGITAGTAGNKTISNLGTVSGGVNFSGVIGDGGAGGTVAVVQNNANSAVTLGGANTFTGGVTLTAGTLNLNNATALGGGAGVFTVNGGTIAKSTATAVTLTNNNPHNWNGDFTLGGGTGINFGTGAVTLGASRTVTLSGTATYTVGGAIDDGAGTFDLNTANAAGSGITAILALNAANTYEGATNVNGGAVRFGSSASLPGTVTVGSGGAVTVIGAHTTLAGWLGDSRLDTTSTGALALTGASSAEAFNPGATGHNSLSLGAELGSTIAYTGAITPAAGTYRVGGGGGTLSLNSPDVFTGATPVVVGGGGGGTVVVAAANDLYTGTVTVAAGTLRIAAGGSIANASVTTNAELEFSSNAAQSFGGAVGGTGFLTKSGTGALTLTGANTYDGPTVVEAGTLVAGATDTLPTDTALRVGTGSSPGAVDLSNFSQTVGSISFLTTNAAATNTVTIGNGQTLRVEGTGSLKVGIPAPFAQGATTNVLFNGGGSLVVDNVAGIFDAGTRNTSQDDNPNTASLDLRLLSSFTANVSEMRVSYDSENATTLRLSNTANTITANTLQVSNTLTNNAGTGTLVLGGGTNQISVNTINLATGKGNGTIGWDAAVTTGTLTLGGKTSTKTNFVVGSTEGTGTAGNLTGTIDLRGHDATVTAGTVVLGKRNDTNTGSGTGIVRFDTGTFDADSLDLGVKSNTGSGTATGTIELSGGALNVLGSTATSFRLATNSGSGAAVGNVVVSGGTLSTNANIVHGGGSGTTTSTLTVEGGTLDLNGNTIGTATASITNVNLRSGTLVDVGEINNGAAIAKTTTGTLIFAGVNTYTGATNVDAGTLRVLTSTALGSPTSTAAVTVADAGLLDLQAAAISDLASVLVTSTDSVAETALNYAGTDLIAALTLNGNVLGDGVYGSTASGAPNTALPGLGLNPDDFFSGTGTLTVGVPEPTAAAALLAVAGGMCLRRRRRA